MFYRLINVCHITKDEHYAYCRLGQTLIANHKHLCYGTLDVNFMFLHFKTHYVIICRYRILKLSRKPLSTCLRSKMATNSIVITKSHIWYDLLHMVLPNHNLNYKGKKMILSLLSFSSHRGINVSCSQHYACFMSTITFLLFSILCSKEAEKVSIKLFKDHTVIESGTLFLCNKKTTYV